MSSLLIKYDISDFIQKWESYMDDLLTQIEQQKKKNKNVMELIEIYKKMSFVDSKMLEILDTGEVEDYDDL
jgi:molecular chaperone GrpE (heat shock protein)